MKLGSVLEHLETIAPLDLAESWDNVGLLVGSKDSDVHCVMCCLTVTESTILEAIERGVNLLISHHPIPFKPLSKITSDSTTGRLLLQAIRAGIAIYSPHTAWDNAKSGINQQLADILGLNNVRPLALSPKTSLAGQQLGTGRCGYANGNSTTGSTTVEELIGRLKSCIPIDNYRVTSSLDRPIHRVGIVCGSGASLLPLIASNQCDAMLTGEATYHQCLEAEALGVTLMMIGHHASEAFAMVKMAEMIQSEFGQLTAFASAREYSRF